MLRGALLVGALAAVAVLAGCGGGSGDRLTKAEYEQEVAVLGESISSSFQGISASTPPEELGEKLRGAQGALQELADRLGEISPPEEIEDAHGRLIEGLRSFSDDLVEVGGKLEAAAGDSAAALAALAGLAGLESVRTLQEVAEELEEKGYDLGVAIPGG